ncbi:MULTISPECIES: hypothetical protein [Mycobacteriaceae]|uniref:hypothetical protein n=1 Tax=Mycobacteriaceae TaxID=1762 RepID=UPI001BDC176E|nr:MULTISPECIES: hypothetical protein [Mycobacteriaceae]MBU8841692.1 hypothetical protein [Mycolicibacterium goodii]
MADAGVGVVIGERKIGQQIIDSGVDPALLTRWYRVRAERDIPPLSHLVNRAFPVRNFKLSL